MRTAFGHARPHPAKGYKLPELSSYRIDRMTRQKPQEYTLFKRWPRWTVWLTGVAIVALYVWAFYFFFVSPTGFRWRAIYGDPHYPDGYEIRGIDISHHQGKINWDRLHNAMINGSPVRFVIIKATEGDKYVDENFEQNFTLAKDNGFIRGAYHYLSLSTPARSQAYFFISKVNLEPGDLPPVLDVEHKPKDMSVEDFQLEVLTWLHIVENKYQVKPIIYTYYKFKDTYLSDERFDGYPYWIAHYYVDKMEYRGDWKFWQHTDAAKLPGINGYVDLDIYNGSFYDLKQLLIPAPTQEEDNEQLDTITINDDSIDLDDD